jgi:hypothetical protein
MRFDYAGGYKKLSSAERTLEDMYSTGEVCQAEDPRIEARKVRRLGELVTRYYITLPAF